MRLLEPHQYLLITKMRSKNGLQEKIQYWDSAKDKKLKMPFSTLLQYSGGTLHFKDLQTDQIIKTISMSEIQANQKPFSVVLNSTHEVMITRPYATPGAFEDRSQKSTGAVASSALGLYLYEGTGERLTHFDKITYSMKNEYFSVEFDGTNLTFTPLVSEFLKFSGKQFSEEVRITLRELSAVEIRSDHRWWRFGFFAAPVVLEGSDYEEVDPTEASQDTLFKVFLAMSVVFAMLFVGWMTLSAQNAEKNQVIESTEIKIDRSMIEAKAIQEKKPAEVIVPAVVEVAPMVPSTPVNVAPARVAEMSAPSEAISTSPAPSQKPSAVYRPTLKQNAKVATVIAARPAGTGTSPGSGAGNAPKGGTGTNSIDSGNSAILARHSQMLQDAFGSVLANKNSANNAPLGAATGGAVNTANGQAMGKGKGIFNTGSGRGPASNGSEATGGIAGGVVNGANPQNFVKVNTGGPLGSGAGGGKGAYGGGTGNIEVSGQGSGVAARFGNGTGGGIGGGSGSSLTHAEVTAVFQKHVAEIRMCYENAMGNQPDLRGTVSLAFNIAPNGAVKKASIQSSDVGGRNPAGAKDTVLADCLLKRLSSWGFPKPRDGQEVQILSYPLVFKSLGNGN